MIKYGLKEFARNIYSNIFIAVQLAIAFIIMTAAVSSVLSRIEMYTPVKKYFPDGKGLYICNIYDTAPLDSELKNIDDVIQACIILRHQKIYLMDLVTIE